VKSIKNIFSLSRAISFLIVLTLILFSFGTFTIPVASAFSVCTNQTPTASVSAGNAILNVQADSCSVEVSFSSYLLPNGVVWPYSAQILNDNITNTYGPGTYNLGPLKLACSWQTDIYLGPVQTQISDQTGTVGLLAYGVLQNQVCAPSTATLHIIKLVVNNNGGTATVSSFSLHVKLSGADVAGSPVAGTGAPGTSYTISPATYAVSEDANFSYTQSFSGDCDASGNITLASGDDKTCTITNDDIATPIIPLVVSSVTSTGGGPLVVPPIIKVVKVANPTSLQNGPGLVTYNYAVSNTGVVAMSNITINDNKCSPVNFVSGDTNNDSKLDLLEIWKYNCTMTLSQTTTNTVVVTGQANGLTATDTANATVVVNTPGFPNTGITPIHLTKISNPSTLPAMGGMVTYAYTVTNPGTLPLSNVFITDDKCSPVNYVSGDLNTDFKLDTSESWIFTCQTKLTETTTSTAVVTGETNSITVKDSASATVSVPVPGFPKTGFSPFGENNPWNNIVILLGDAIVVLVAFIVVFKKHAYE
jgi:uncharacterized repeat protein (TIGR01451 family)